MDAQLIDLLTVLPLPPHLGLLCFSSDRELLYSNAQARELLGLGPAASAAELIEAIEIPWDNLPDPTTQPTFILPSRAITARLRTISTHAITLLTLEPTLPKLLLETLASYPLALVSISTEATPLNAQAIKLLGPTDQHAKLRWSIQNHYQESQPINSPLNPSYKGLGEDVIMLQRPDHETRFVRVYALTTHHLQHAQRILAVEDISEQHQRELLKEELLSVASHELRNPLTPLKGLLQLAMQQHEEDQEVDFTLLQKAEAQVSRLVKLANTLLDVSRLESGRLNLQLETHDLVSTLDDLLAVWLMRYGKERFKLNLPTSPCLANIDLASFEQVLSNILDNAIKFSPSHEPIFITLRRQSASNNNFELLIEDRGIGIEKQKLPMLFKRFYQGDATRRHRGGLGLGLYICQKIIQEHRGQIFIESDKGGPTIVHIQIPQAG